jgi:hypothetical protein
MNEEVSQKAGRGTLRVKRIIYYITGVLEVLLVCRFVLKLFGANSGNIFVSILYSVSQVFLLPFVAIFRLTVKGIETPLILEPVTLIAIIVYAFISYVVIKFIKANETKIYEPHKNGEMRGI